MGLDLRQLWRVSMLARRHALDQKDRNDEKNTGRRKLENAWLQNHGQ